MTVLHETTDCEVCGNSNLVAKLNLGSHPLCDDLIPVTETVQCEEYPIEILYCAVCNTAHQKYQVEKKILFPRSYHYRAKHTQDVQNGMKELVAYVDQKIGSVQGKSVLDIGCNDGSLLNYFRESGAYTFGIEPTGAAADATDNGHTVTNDFFEETVATEFKSAHGNPDIISFTNVFAHIEDLRGVISALKVLIKPETILVIENHYLGAILKRDQFDTFYHEHPRTYSLNSFKHIAASLGMTIVSFEFPARYGGNIRVIMSQIATPSETDVNAMDGVIQEEQSFGKGLDRLAKRVEIWKRNKSAQIQDLIKQHGPIKAKAFPGRSAIPVKILGLDVAQISGVYEKDTSDKVGHMVPGTRIPIFPDAKMDDDGDKDAPLLNLAWHISPEINTYMRASGYAGPIIDIIDPQDFIEGS